ncbi:MAG TPA: uracil-DNA glycosylase [Rhizomicrobium sp.]|nr:uracil-DNA glycosylase [Rhizomicrobium sp.]
MSQNPLADLVWLVEAGADEAVGEAPVDRFAARAPVAKLPAKASERPAAPRPAAAPAPRPAPVIEGDGIGTAMALAGNAGTLAELKAALEGFEGCALKRSATTTVFADGNPQSRVLFIGEAPGRDEDRQGLPFVGRAGQLLNKMLAAIDLDRTKAYITNVINWRPPDNREPSPEEAAMCLPFLRRHIELVNPRVMILLGAVSVRHVMGRSDGIMKTRGRWLEYNVGGRMVPVMPTLHPAYLLRQPAHKKLAWRDLQAIALKLEQTARDG